MPTNPAGPFSRAEEERLCLLCRPSAFSAPRPGPHCPSLRRRSVSLHPPSPSPACAATGGAFYKPRAPTISKESPLWRIQAPQQQFVLQGKVMHEVGVETVGVGALKLTGFLKELLQQRNITFESLYTVRTIKEKLCYVAANYDAELRKDTLASCEVAGEGWFTLSKERFQTGEILFQPQIGGVGGLHALGLHRALGLCVDHCAAAEVASDDGWYKTVVLAGGTACLPGLQERLEKELHKFLPSSISEGIKVIPPPYGVDSAWFGAKFVSNVSPQKEFYSTVETFSSVDYHIPYRLLCLVD